MTVDVVFVRMRGNDVLVIRKRLLRQLLGQAVGFFGGNIILWVKAVLEVVILPAVIPLRLVKQLRCFGELPRIVAVVVKCVGSDDCCFLFIGDVVDRFSGLGFTAAALESGHVLTLLTARTAHRAGDMYSDTVAG